MSFLPLPGPELKAEIGQIDTAIKSGILPDTPAGTGYDIRPFEYPGGGAALQTALATPGYSFPVVSLPQNFSHTSFWGDLATFGLQAVATIATGGAALPAIVGQSLAASLTAQTVQTRSVARRTIPWQTTYPPITTIPPGLTSLRSLTSSRMRGLSLTLAQSLVRSLRGI